MFQKFLLKSMLARQMKGVPQEQQDKIFAMIEKNPDFFTKIAEQVQEKVNGGMSKEQAIQQIMMAHQDELKGMMS